MIKNISLQKHLKTLFFSLSIISLTPSIAYSRPAKIWTAWQGTNLNARECIRRAESAVRNTGYSSNLEIFGGDSPTAGVYGESGDYSVTVRCGTNAGIVFFVSAGPEAGIASSELNTLIQNF